MPQTLELAVLSFAERDASNMGDWQGQAGLQLRNALLSMAHLTELRLRHVDCHNLLPSGGMDDLTNLRWVPT